LFQWAYDASWYQMPRYDPAAARAVLAPLHLDLSLIVRADKPTAVAFATEVQAAEAAAGVTVTLKRWPVIALVAPDGPLYGGRYDLALFPFVGGPDPDVTDQFSCDRIPPRGFNKPRYCNPSLDRAMQDAASTYDRQTRRVRYRAIQRTLASDLPLDALYQLVIIDAFPSRLRGESTAPTGPFWNVANWAL
jgi:peptide/nickel transport system substrate-binding protein